MPDWINIQEHFAICNFFFFFAFKTVPRGHCSSPRQAVSNDHLLLHIICLTQSIVWIFTSFNYKCLNSNMSY